MKLETRNGLRILTCEYGYVIHNKLADTYAYKIYLGINASVDDFEEVLDNSIDIKLRDAVFTLQEKEQSLMKIGKLVANEVSDDTIALSIQEFYDEWKVGITYEVGKYIKYEDVLYKVITSHTSQEDWTPSNATSLFAKVLIDPTGETILDWVQPDSTNPYMKGDKVTHNGVTYISIIDSNVWEPGVYGWEILEES